MHFFNHIFDISIDNEYKRKTFLVNFFSIAALLSLSIFGIVGFLNGNTTYSIYIFSFFSITLLNILFLKFTKRVKFSAHIVIILMFIFAIIVFSFLGVGISGLFWFYAIPALTIALTDYKRGSLYSFLFLIVTLIIYSLKPSFLITNYPLDIILRFIASYTILNILIILFEYSRQKTQKELNLTVYKLKEVNEELSASEEELRVNNEDLFLAINKLSDNQKRLSLAQKAGGIGIWEWDVENDTLIWSDTTYNILGVKKEQKKINSEFFFNIVHKDDKEKISNELNIAIKNNTQFLKTNYRIITQNEVKYIEETSELIKNKNGRLIKMIGVLQDVTERKKTENEINEKNEELKSITEKLKLNNKKLFFAKEEISEKNNILKETISKYELLSNSISDFIWMLSFDLKPIYISSSCKNFIGYTIEELQNLDIKEFHTKQSFNKILKLLQDTIELRKHPKEATGIKTEIEYIHKNGDIIIAEVYGYLIFNEKKEPIAIGGVSRNITKRKKAELALKESNKKIAQAHNSIISDIRYAKNIQEGLLTKKIFIDNLLNEYFLIFKQRYSVGGDFYYVNKKNDYIIFAVGDCTGHGVPGGLLSMIAITYLHEIINNEKIKTTGLSLDIIRQRFKRIFDDNNYSGFNIALCAINTKTNVLLYSGAYHPLLIVRNNQLLEYKATRNPVGHFFNEVDFETKEIQLKKDDRIYIFSDGYFDQLNPEGKKIGKKQFKELLLKNSNLPFAEQKQALFSFFNNWKKDQIQIDDITILGLKWEG